MKAAPGQQWAVGTGWSDTILKGMHLQMAEAQLWPSYLLSLILYSDLCPSKTA
jgi:hypothetical protein